MQKKLFFLVTLLLTATTLMAQITTSSISGKITSEGEPVIGATITATHQPSGTVYRAVTNIDGRYTIPGMRVGGPYKVEVSYVGHKTKTFNNVNLLLGETQDLSCTMQEDAKVLDELVVTGKRRVECHKDGCRPEYQLRLHQRHAKYHSWYSRRNQAQSPAHYIQRRSYVVCRNKQQIQLFHGRRRYEQRRVWSDIGRI